MTFAPLVPFGGVAGWTFLKRTMEAQKSALSSSPVQQRDQDYFREKIGSIRTADDLVSDRRLLRVALGAFGLDADINNKYFIKKVLQDGTLKPEALANRLSDKQYLAMSEAFGFGDFSVPNTVLSDFPDKILTPFKDRQFEAAVGEQNDDLRLVMNAERELAKLAEKTNSDETKWFTILGSAPLRKVFEQALALPSSLASIDLDQQLSIMKQKADKVFGDDGIAQFANPDTRAQLFQRFLVRSEASGAGGALTPGASALQLLQARGSSGSILSILR